MNRAYLLIGGNMGNREELLYKARTLLEQQCGRLRPSSLYETAAWGLQDQAPFLNQALELLTELPPHELLQTILRIEEDLGRKRELRYGPRLIDIDILLFNDDVIELPGLRVPHPEMQNRRFVLEPLCEIAGEKIHPVLNMSMKQILSACTDPLTVHKFS